MRCQIFLFYFYQWWGGMLQLSDIKLPLATNNININNIPPATTLYHWTKTRSINKIIQWMFRNMPGLYISTLWSKSGMINIRLPPLLLVTTPSLPVDFMPVVSSTGEVESGENYASLTQSTASTINHYCKSKQRFMWSHWDICNFYLDQRKYNYHRDKGNRLNEIQIIRDWNEIREPFVRWNAKKCPSNLEPIWRYFNPLFQGEKSQNHKWRIIYHYIIIIHYILHIISLYE